MTKTLTEQWKDGSFKFGVYYCQTKDDGILKLELCHEGDGHGYAYCYGEEECYRYEDIEEVLAPVPSYDEYKELTQRVGRLELDNEVLEDVVQECNKRGLENKKLQEQLKEANEVIKYYAEGIVEDQEEDENGEVMSYEYPASNDQESASSYLKKWGVK